MSDESSEFPEDYRPGSEASEENQTYESDTHLEPPSDAPLMAELISDTSSGGSSPKSDVEGFQSPYGGNASFIQDSPRQADRNTRLRWWSPLLMVLISLASYLAVSGVMSAVALVVVTGDVSPELFEDPIALQNAMSAVLSSRIGLFLSLVVPQIALVSPCLIAASISPVPFTERLGLVKGEWPVWSWLAVGAASPLVGIISGVVLSQFVEESDTLKQMNDVFRDHGASGFFLPLAFMIGVTPAFCEELLFRGYIQQRLARVLPPGLGIFIASFLFAAFHIDFVHVLAVFPLGLFLGWVTWRSGSLFPAMVGHFVNNFVSVIGIVFSPDMDQDSLELPAATLTLSVFIFGFIGAILIGVVARRQRLAGLHGNTVIGDVNSITGNDASGEELPS
ncbi:MAG: type II CAAX prenyl endopeptidase Rce1 family protein [Rubripirellula sp.]